MKTADPHISVLRRFARAMNVRIEEIVGRKTQLETQEVEFEDGMTGYVYERPNGHWEIRYCSRLFRGRPRQELPESLRGEFQSDKEARRLIAAHYDTKVTFVKSNRE